MIAKQNASYLPCDIYLLSARDFVLRPGGFLAITKGRKRGRSKYANCTAMAHPLTILRILIFWLVCIIYCRFKIDIIFAAEIKKNYFNVRLDVL